MTFRTIFIVYGTVRNFAAIVCNKEEVRNFIFIAKGSRCPSTAGETPHKHSKRPDTPWSDVIGGKPHKTTNDAENDEIMGGLRGQPKMLPHLY